MIMNGQVSDSPRERVMMGRSQLGRFRLAVAAALVVAVTLAVVPATVQADVKVSAPGRPGTPVLSQDRGHVILQWTEPSGGGPFSGHRIWRRAQDETEAAMVLEVNGADLFTYDPAPRPGITYRYQVQAFGPGGDGARSPAATITTDLEKLRGGFLVRNSESHSRPFTLSGTTGTPVLFDIKYSGTDRFKMFLVDSNQYGGRYERLLTPGQLFGPFGPYEGVRALSYRDGVFEGQEQALDAFNVRVEGDGAWELKIGLPNFTAPPVTIAEGIGDSVVGPWALTSPNPFVADFHFAVTHQGREFSARLIASDGTVRTLVPQQVAAFTNRKATVNVFAPWNPDKGADDLHYDDYVLDIQADREWAVRLINPAPEPAPRVEGIPLGRVLGTYTGSGSEDLVHVLAAANVPSSPVLFDIDFRGGSAFEVALESMFAHYERRLTPDGLTGPYHGVLALPYKDGELDGQTLSAFNISVEALGGWEVKIGLPDFSVAAVTSANGWGDSVIGPFVLSSEDPFSSDFLFEVTHEGANFEARLIASDGTDVLLIPPQHLPFENKRAPVTVYVPHALAASPDDLSQGDYVLAVQADGEWSVRLLEPETDS